MLANQERQDFGAIVNKYPHYFSINANGRVLFNGWKTRYTEKELKDVLTKEIKKHD